MVNLVIKFIVDKFEAQDLILHINKNLFIINIQEKS